MSLNEQVAIITGATSGIGRGVALELGRCGMKLVVSGRREDRLKSLCDEVGGAVTAVAADILDPATPRRLLDTALNTFGRCDFVLNGAGSMHAGLIESIDLEATMLMIRANYEAAVRMAYEALRHFKSVNAGTLINISSILGTKVRPGTGAYAGTKYAIEALSEALRMELAGTNVRVSVIEPGVTNSELQNHFEKHPREVLGITEPLTPEDIARCVKFILEQPPHVRIPVLMVLPGQQAM